MALFQEKLSLSSTYSSFHSLPRILVPKPLSSRVAVTRSRSICRASWQEGETLDYLGIPGLHLAGSQGVIVIAICQVLLMVGPEYARYCGIEALEPLGIYLPGDINYPGGTLFDPLNLSEDPVAFEDLKVKEIKNGRLAMVAWLGFYSQAAFTGKGPVQNLVDYVSDPLHNNLVAMLLQT